MTLKYIAEMDILSCYAANLVISLQDINSSIYIINKNKKVNGKSLVGLLSGQIRQGDIFTVIIDNNKEQKNIEKILKEYGREIND